APALPDEVAELVLVVVTLGLDVGDGGGCQGPHFGGLQVVVDIEQRGGGQAQAAQRLDGGAAVFHLAGPPHGPAVGVQRAADVQGVCAAAGAEDQRLFLVEQGTGDAQVQALAGGDGGGAERPRDGFLTVGKVAGGDGD